MQQPGRLSFFARALFASVTVGHLGMQSIEDEPPWRAGKAVEGSLRLSLSFSSLPRCIRIAGGAMQALRIGTLHNRPVGCERAVLLDALKDKCPALRRLDVIRESEELTGEMMMHALEGRLHILSAFKCISLNAGKGLQELIVGSLSPDMAELRAAGRTLHSIKVADISEQGERVFHLMRAACPELRNIDLRFLKRRCMLEEYSDLLIFYGPQLRYANLDSFPKEMCEKVIGACPNARCEVKGWGGGVVEKMGALGSSIATLRLSDSDFAEMPNLEVATQACANIAKINLFASSSVAADKIRELLIVEKRLLKHFKLECLDSRNADDAVWGLGERVRSLEHLTCSLSLQSVESLKLIAERNARLERVDIYLNHGPTDEECTVSLVKSFLKCPRLQFLAVRGRRRQGRLESLANIFCRMQRVRRRAMFANVYGVQYCG